MSGPAAPKYGFLGRLNIKRIDTPAQGQGYAETWPAGETGAPDRPRPQELPLNQNGIQVFRPDQWSEDDTAGEALHIDPVARAFSSKFAATLTPAQVEELKRQPDFAASGGESPERQMQNAVDAAMRGYLVGQWPAEAVQKFFTPRQAQMLDELKAYMQTGQTPEEQMQAGFNKVVAP